ncbi:hypothetical protein ACFX2J_037388 [Malus domestica]
MSLRPSTRTEVRLNNYKVAVDADEGRRRREDNMVEIWKNKGEESLLKKRREGFQAQQFAPYLQPSNLKKKLESLPAIANSSATHLPRPSSTPSPPSKLCNSCKIRSG